MNRAVLSGYIKEQAFLVSDDSGDQYLVGVIATPKDWAGDGQQVAVIYDKAIAKTPYWELAIGDHVYISGYMRDEKLPMKGGGICDRWLHVEHIEALPPINPDAIKTTKVQRLMDELEGLFL